MNNEKTGQATVAIGEGTRAAMIVKNVLDK
jgi:hypothetical protein